MFKIGDSVLVKKGLSDWSHILDGQIGIIVKHNGDWVLLDIERDHAKKTALGTGGIWIRELSKVAFMESDYEYV